MPDFDVIVVGEVCVDLILSGNVEPRFGQVEQIVDDSVLTIGSSSAIFACGAARLGVKVAFIGKIGDDTFGYFMRDSLAARGIDVTGIVVDPEIKTGISVILSRGADRAILTYLGSISALRFDEVDQTLISRARHLHLGSYFLLQDLQPDIPRLFALAKGNRLTTSLDTNYDPQRTWDSGLRNTFSYVDYFMPNETEIHGITGLTDTEAALNQLAKELMVVAVKRGSSGALAQSGADVVSAPALPVAVQDTTGAGDTFDAGFIYGMLSGWKLSQALKLGSICGSLSTRGLGGTGAQPDLEEALQYLPKEPQG
ncbi:MAG: carbohydrate kinase family protein [Chloroflexota bacterium]|nr:MAG: carbohydrate kinase family protein [Chloroflexota bacterium]